MADNPRGIADVELGGKTYKLRLNVGAAMDIEEEFDCPLDAIEEKLETPRIRDMVRLLQILAKGGGNEIDNDVIRDFDVEEMAIAVEKAFGAASEGTSQESTKKKSQSQRRGGAGKK